MTKLKTLIKDPRGSILWTLDNLWTNFKSRPETLLACLNAWAWGIEISLSSQFFGLPHFKRYPGSMIQIGKQCRFRSDFSSNLVGINRPCGISTHSKRAQIIIGNNCGFSGSIVGAYEKIEIGNGVIAGANTTITDFDWHSVNPANRSTGGEMRSAPILIEDNVWLGLNCLILKGVTIGENTIVGANAVVASSLPANVIAAGNPARVLHTLES
jgi:acetyltransferase-like isoleucine patch superfamily enzyme